jgi:hypothetical protein
MCKGLNFGPGDIVSVRLGLDEAVIRAYIRNQEEKDKHEDQMTITY